MNKNYIWSYEATTVCGLGKLNMSNEDFKEMFEHIPLLEKALIEATKGGNHE